MTKGSLQNLGSVFMPETRRWLIRKESYCSTWEVPEGSISSPDRKGFVNLRVQKAETIHLFCGSKMLFLLQLRHSDQFISVRWSKTESLLKQKEKLAHSDKKYPFLTMSKQLLFVSIHVRFASFQVKSVWSVFMLLLFLLYVFPREKSLTSGELAFPSFYVERFLTISSCYVQLGRGNSTLE